jgi:hypothetical protein
VPVCSPYENRWLIHEARRDDTLRSKGDLHGSVKRNNNVHVRRYIAAFLTLSTRAIRQLRVV